MARLKAPTADTDLRLYLLAEAEAFRETLTAGQPSCVREVIWRELSKPIDQLAAGKGYALHRFQLPDDHPAARGEPSDWLLLRVDDMLAS